MSLINHEELKKQLASGEITSLDDITAEFKNILKEVILLFLTNFDPLF